MYMVVPLEVGYNKIKLSYTILGLKYGMMISGLALVVLIFWEKIRKYKRKQVRKYKRKK
jgi:sensor histidine kinase regulating citrate/malate metabolism